MQVYPLGGNPPVLPSESNPPVCPSRAILMFEHNPHVCPLGAIPRFAPGGNPRVCLQRKEVDAWFAALKVGAAVMQTGLRHGSPPPDESVMNAQALMETTAVTVLAPKNST